MNAKVLSILTGLIIVGLVAAVILLQQNPSTVNNSSLNTQQVSDTSNENLNGSNTNSLPTSFGNQNSTLTQQITRAEVAMNNTIDSCYVIYNSNVYKIPASWAGDHPGGRSEIINSCGTDITEAFNQGQHDFDALQMLNTFFIGELAN